MKRNIHWKCFFSAKGASTQGLTLIEVLIATTVSSLLLMILYGAYASIISTVTTVTARAEFDENVHMALTVIDRSIGNAHLRPGRKNIHFIGTARNDNSSIHFVEIRPGGMSVAGTLDNNLPVSDINTVEFYCMTDPLNNGLYLLMKGEHAGIAEDIEAAGTSSLLLKNVESLKFSFLENNNWVRSWDSRLHGRYPGAVKTEISVRSYTGDTEYFEFITSFSEY